MKTYWNVEVQVDGTCKCSSGDTDLGTALSRALSDAIYYRAIYPEAKDIRVAGIRESCAGCHNLGTVTKRRPRSVKTVKCPECKGKLANGAIPDVPLAMPDPANGIRLIQCFDRACTVCGAAIGRDAPSGVCSIECLNRGQGFVQGGAA